MLKQLQGIDDYIQETMQSWHAPGVALAVLHQGEVAHLRGYGYRDLENQKPITPQTLFPLASVTKAFTAMGVALLVDEGKLEWDQPVRRYLPWFKLANEYASTHLTPRDLLCHRSGLPRHEFVWLGTPFTRRELVEKLAYLKPNEGFRSTWQYQNLMYVTAGYLTGQVAGMTWEEFIQTRIFDVLGMNSSGFSIQAMRATDDHALGYQEKKGEISRRDHRDAAPCAPAGAINSTLEDMVKWLKVHLNDGQYDGGQFVSAGNLAQMHQPQMVMKPESIIVELLQNTIFTYGLGWFVQPYRGYTLIHHGGNIDGFSTLVSFVPQAKIGVIVLTNINGKPLPDLLTYTILDRMLELPGGEWNQKYHAIWEEIEKAQDQSKETTEEERVPNTTPSRPLADYAGAYANPGYADFVVKLTEDGALTGLLGGEDCPLNHYHYDIFELVFDKFDVRFKVSFITDEKGNISTVSIPIEPLVENIIFTRKPETVSVEVLQQLVGEYATEMEGLSAIFRLNADNVLIGQMTGQPGDELIPYKGTEFKVKGVPSLMIEFVPDERGIYNEVLLKQPYVVFKATRTPKL